MPARFQSDTNILTADLAPSSLCEVLVCDTESVPWGRGVVLQYRISNPNPSREISFVHDIHFSCQIVLEIRKECDNYSAQNCQNDLIMESSVYVYVTKNRS